MKQLKTIQHKQENNWLVEAERKALKKEHKEHRKMRINRRSKWEGV